MDIAHEGAIVLNLLVAGVLTLAIGTTAVVLLQRSIRHNMMLIGATPASPAPAPQRPRQPAQAPLSFDVAVPATVDASLSGRLLRRHVLAHALAGLAFAVTATLLLLPLSGIALLPLRTMVVVWAYAWPTVLVLGLLIGPDRRVQLLILSGYFGVLAMLGAWARLANTPSLAVAGIKTPGFVQPVIIWLLYAAPSLFLLLFLNRTIRTIGPLVLVFAFVVMLGAHAAISLLTITPIQEAVILFAISIGMGGAGILWTVGGLGMLAAIWPAWGCVTWLRDRYAAKRSTELIFTAGAIWMLQALVLAYGLSREQGAIAALAALAPLVAWRLALSLALRPLVASVRARPPQRLLLLRVFGFGRRSRRLLDLLGTRWRLIGSIDLIAAPDLASRTIEPSTFLEFVRGRLSRLFIRTHDDLRARLAALDHRPDPDARFRINQLFCSDEIWKAGVTRLMEEASLVVMDLRGFTPDRRGCVYELQTLLDTVPLVRLAFVFDKSTDLDALETILTQQWQELDDASPNLASERPTLRLLNASDGDPIIVRHLLAIAAARQ
ncbi:MAG: hypothetical protein ACRECO_08385 [Xanthobacteraceae bacterium]